MALLRHNVQHILTLVYSFDSTGFTARVIRLRRHESVFICGTMADEIVLPATPAQLKIFMDGRSLSALFRLRVRSHPDPSLVLALAVDVQLIFFILLCAQLV